MNMPRLPCTIRLMTWNIHGGIGPDRRFDLDRIAALIRRHEPDILALQELDTRGRDPQCLAPLHALSGADGHFAETRTIVAADGHYGHAIFSRWPIETAITHDLSMHRREPRSAIETTIATSHGPVHLIAVHLGLKITERRAQVARLAQLAQQTTGLATVMLGDFNDWFSFGRVRKALAASLPSRTTIATFPARRPTLKLDRIYSSIPNSIVRSWTDSAGRQCSDHLPLIGELQLSMPSREGI